ncbi:MAG: hypothetical protein KDA17_06555 [Candidatus Saccharibacteria bacterium]|nr:hypothetical protein [Candidatus Saccharibacteria bacterium]
MNQAARTIIGVIIALVVLGLVRTALNHTTAPTNNIPTSPITAEQYLKAVDTKYSNNELYHCIYSTLLDRYGVSEVMSMDTESVAKLQSNPDYVDSRALDAINECSE